MAAIKVSQITFNPAGLEYTLHSRNGIVGEDLQERVDRVVERAKFYASGNPIGGESRQQFALFGGGAAVRGAGGRFQRSRTAEAQASLNTVGRGPNIVTGNLYGSIRGEVIDEGHQLVGVIGTDVEYGYYLETGVRGGRTYPFLRPALDAAHD